MTKLIAEIGINHLGDEKKLFSMIKTLAENKISSCKLQYRGDDDFFDNALEMGSTLISQELENVNLSLATTVSAIEYSKGLGIEVGVSFFRIADAKKLTNIVMPDYFKVPSAEALNFELIQFLQTFDRPVYVSTGGLSYFQLQEVAKEITFRQMDCVMYCVANYPANIGASTPSYIDQYRSMFNCQIGYSSHDMHWEMNIAFLDRNVDIIERHFTDDKNDQGLDISTSSDIKELIKLQAFCNSSIWSQNHDFKQKNANQGELQNIKDLGSGYYFKENYIEGDEVNVSDLLIKSPCRGIKAGSLKNVIRLSTDAVKGDPLSLSHLTGSVSLSAKTKDLANNLDLSIPVRLHDFVRIDETFNMKNYEWHLSYTEVEKAHEFIFSNLRNYINGKKFSIHLPDYISSSYLLDPISYRADIKGKSIELIEKVIVLAENLQELTGNEVPVIGSFSVMNDCKARFYSELTELIYGYHQTNRVKIMPQFLPKIAWYFGGSVELNVFCDICDLDFFEKLPFGICLDVAHCIMAANYFDQSHIQWIEKLLPIAGHIHVSDARGISGEGVPFGDGELEGSLYKILSASTRKVFEQWDGHLDDFRGFKESLNYLTQQQEVFKKINQD